MELDHLVITAATLEDGVRWCEATLGVTPGPGGKHPLMGTHNRLLRLGGFPAAFLEIIAIDPEAPPPVHTRWFGLDGRPRDAEPALVHWVARCDHLRQRCETLARLGFDPGAPTAASRDTPQGLLSWTISVRPDGQPQAAGALPTLIEWRSRHPAEQMPLSGLTLDAVEVGGLPASVADHLAAPSVAFAGAAGLRATLRSPRGLITLETAGR